MKGKDLKKLIADSGLKALDLIRDSGIPQKTFYELYKKDYIEAHYIEKLRKAGVNVLESVIDYEKEFMKTRIKDLENHLEDVRAEVKMYRFLLNKWAQESPMV